MCDVSSRWNGGWCRTWVALHGKTSERGCKQSAKVRNECITLSVPCSGSAAHRECHVRHEEHHGCPGGQQPAGRAARGAHAPRAAAVSPSPAAAGPGVAFPCRSLADRSCASAAACQQRLRQGSCSVAIKEKQ